MNDTAVIRGHSMFCRCSQLTSDVMWNPWEWIGKHYPHITVTRQYKLPARMGGLWKGDTIWLCSSLNQAERRSVLTHEIEHVRRGLVAPAFRDREERLVDELAARRLIRTPELADALRLHRDDPASLAEALWVDEHTIRVRMSTLDPIEVAELEHELEDQWLWIP